MTTKFSADFDRQFAKLSKEHKQQVMDAIELFLDEPTHSALRNHPLTEEWAGWHSISAGDDLRVHYKLLDSEAVFFVAVGTHGELYK